MTNAPSHAMPTLTVQLLISMSSLMLMLMLMLMPMPLPCVRCQSYQLISSHPIPCYAMPDSNAHAMQNQRWGDKG